MKTNNKYYYFDSNKPSASYDIGVLLTELMLETNRSLEEIIILCIGTDRSTGDSLGPIIGYKLKSKSLCNDKVIVYGTLDHPVHATNLVSTLQKIKEVHHNPYIIAIDASVGRECHIGYITVGVGPLKPGLGVNKSLPDVGDLHITGIVNVGGQSTPLLLQTTRLNTVMNLADTITMGIIYSVAPRLLNSKFQVALLNPVKLAHNLINRYAD